MHNHIVTMPDGYVYCFTNTSYNGLCKIGMTEKTPDDRLRQANRNSTWLPSLFVIEFAIKVSEPKDKERTLHKTLRNCRESPNREFFRISPEELKTHFDAMSEEYWEKSKTKAEKPKPTPKAEGEKPKMKGNVKNPDGCRDMSKCFTDGQKIRHTIRSVNSTHIGTYDATQNEVVYEGTRYRSLSAFGGAHYKATRPDRREKTNGWRDCEYEENGAWKSTYNIIL